MITDIFLGLLFFSMVLAMVKPRFLYEHFNNSYCNIISPIILKNNMLEYFGAVINNDGEIININENILKYQYINIKLPIYSYVQDTMFQYVNLYIIKNINNILTNNRFNKKNFYKKSYEYSQYMNNIKFYTVMIKNK